MLFPLLLFSFSLAVLFIATYTDLKERIVPNRLTYGAIFLGIALHAAYALYKAEPMLLAYSAFAACYAFAFSLLLYKTGVWAGGDVKLFTGIAALNPVNPFIAGALGLYSHNLFAALSFPVFPLTLFVFTLFSMFPVTVFITMKRACRDKAAFYSLARDLAIVVALGIAWLLLLAHSFAYLLMLLFASALLLFMLKLMVASRVFLRKSVKVGKLEEGMIPAETIIERGGEIERRFPQGMKNFINQIRQYTLAGRAEKGARIIADSRRARGLTEREIAELRKLEKKGKLDSVLVKESAPMVPAILVGYIILNFVGDLLWNAVF